MTMRDGMGRDEQRLHGQVKRIKNRRLEVEILSIEENPYKRFVT